MKAKEPRKHKPEVNQALQATYTERMRANGYVRFSIWSTPENKIKIMDKAKELDKKYPPKPI